MNIGVAIPCITSIYQSVRSSTLSDEIIFFLLEDHTIAILWLIGGQMGPKLVCSDFCRCVPCGDKKTGFSVIGYEHLHKVPIRTLHVLGIVKGIHADHFEPFPTPIKALGRLNRAFSIFLKCDFFPFSWANGPLLVLDPHSDVCFAPRQLQQYEGSAITYQLFDLVVIFCFCLSLSHPSCDYVFHFSISSLIILSSFLVSECVTLRFNL